MRLQQLPSAKKLLRRSAGRRAFSLVEVALSVGIAGSALLVIFSLIPVGLSSLQDTGREIVETEIYNKIGSELATTSEYSSPTAAYQNLLKNYCADPNRFPAYFDAEGNELSRGTAPAPAQTVFQVRCTYGDGTGGSGQKGNDGNKPYNTVWTPAGDGELLSATVNVGYHQDPGPTPTPSANVRQRTFLLSNHGN